jgi:hypothetical protein
MRLVRPREQVTEGTSLLQGQPNAPPVFWPVMQHVAALAECFQVPVPTSAMGRVMVEMRSREHHACGPGSLGQRRRRAGDAPATSVPPDPACLVPPPTVPEMPDGLPVRPPADLASTPRPYEAHPLADLAPVDGVEEPQLGSDRHRVQPDHKPSKRRLATRV